MERAVVREAESGVSEMEVTVTCSVERGCRGCRKIRTSVHSRSFPGAEPERQNCKDRRWKPRETKARFFVQKWQFSSTLTPLYLPICLSVFPSGLAGSLGQELWSCYYFFLTCPLVQLLEHSKELNRCFLNTLIKYITLEAGGGNWGFLLKNCLPDVVGPRSLALSSWVSGGRLGGSLPRTRRPPSLQSVGKQPSFLLCEVRCLGVLGSELL